MNILYSKQRGDRMLQAIGLTKSFGDLHVLNDFSLKMDKGEVISVIGPSGTGKSTLLRCLNYLEEPTSGTVSIDGLRIEAGKAGKKEIHEFRKSTSMVFQNYNLFANKTAVQNIMEPMVIAQKIKKTEAYEKAMDILNLVGLADKKDSYPSQLSGGQQQRVGIGRAMGTAPKVILFDEPTSSLDPELIGEVLDVIRKLASQRTTMLITTHEMEFARSISDRIIFLDGGAIAEQGTPEQIFHQSQYERTRQFLKAFYLS